MLKVVQDAEAPNEDGAAGGSLLDEIVRDGARQMLAAALRAEVAAYIEAHAAQLDADGHRLVVRNGYHAERQVMSAGGAVPVRAPRVNDKRIDEETGQRKRFSSAILPAWARKSPQVAEVLPLLYLHGLSSSDFGPALEQFVGTGAGLSAATIIRLTTQWQDEAAAFGKRSLAETDYVYVWVDGIQLKVAPGAGQGMPPGDDRDPCGRDQGAGGAGRWVPRVLGVLGRLAPLMQTAGNAGAGAGGRRWGAWVLEGAARGVPGHAGAAVLVAQGGQRAQCLAQVHPAGREDRLAEIYNAEDREHALKAVKAFETDYGTKWPKAVAKITEDVNVLLAFYDYPAEHWVHLRTTKPISVNRPRRAGRAGAA